MYESINERDDLSYTIDSTSVESARVIREISEEIKVELNEIELLLKTADTANRNNVIENERKVGEALVFILDNWENILNFAGGNKYNKNSILSCIREATNLNTKDIRNAMKKYKKIYSIVLENNINN